MEECKVKKKRLPPSETPLSGKHRSQSKAQRSGQTLKQKSESAAEPEPSCVSYKSNKSHGVLVNFKSEQCFPSERSGQTLAQKSESAAEPEPSCVSYKSNKSHGVLVNFKSDHCFPSERSGPTSESAAEPEPSCVSYKSNKSHGVLVNFKSDHCFPSERVKKKTSEISSVQRAQQHQTQQDSIFQLLQNNLFSFVENELQKIQRFLKTDHSECLEGQKEDEEMLEDEDEEQTQSCREAFTKITISILRRMKQEELADSLQSKLFRAVSQHRLKSSLKKKFQCVFEGIAKAGNPALLNQIYTELYITEGGGGEINEEHEVRQIETATRKPQKSEITIKRQDIFKSPPGRDEPVRMVMTKGVAGIGKTVLTQKFIMDWAEDKANQNIQFMFPFTFRELNLLKDKKFSLVELVHHFFTETKEISCFEQFQVVFIFDGLDECRLPLDFQNQEILTDATESTSVDVLLTNLIRGKLLPSACIWITTRPAAANQIPPECVGMVTEVRGFTDPQKEEYFRKRFRDEKQANRIISHIKTSRSLHIMCHIPVFCWITATVLEEVLENRERGELPRTLTEMYIHFLVVQTKLNMVKYDGGAEKDGHWSKESRETIDSLGKLAFDQLQKGNLIFYDSDLIECGIDIRAASVTSGLFTQIFKEDTGLYQDRVFCFVHLSVQEFLAALHVHLTFTSSHVNLLEKKQTASSWSKLSKKKSLKHLHQSALDKALDSPNGHLDLFLRFLLGLSLQTNQGLLRGLLKKTAKNSEVALETVQYIKRRLDENLSTEKSINLFYCLNELKDQYLVEEIQQSISSGNLSVDKLSPAQWSALGFILLDKDRDVFDLKNYTNSEEVLLKLLSVIKVSHKALLNGCNLLEKSCEALSSVLSSRSYSLEELDLSNNDLKNAGVKLLSAGLESPNCTLKTLRLSGCLISEDGCVFLASALSSNHFHLRELDLSYNHPGGPGLKRLLDGLTDPHWSLSTLRAEPAGGQWLTPGLRKYSCQLTIDTNTVNTKLKLLGNKMVMHAWGQSYPDHPDRFDGWCPQLLCRDVLTGRCYWEVEWKGDIDISVSYRRIGRKGNNGCSFGMNDLSWSLNCSKQVFTAWHDSKKTCISCPSVSNKVAVYVDCDAGVLSFYSISSDTLIHLHTFNTSFTEPLYPGFRVCTYESSMSLC